MRDDGVGRARGDLLGRRRRPVGAPDARRRVARAAMPAGVGSAVAVALVAVLALGCTPAASPSGGVGASPTASVAASGAPAGPDPRDELASLVIDDGPPPGGYLRDLFPTWKDIDGDGCDARRQALIAASATPARLGARCAVIEGSWTSAYDGVTTTDPADIQIDHVVPLANAWRSGADGWTTDERTRFANDQGELWAVSASSNQSKGDRGPDQWRPPREEVWCEYARRWTAVKVRWRLTATSSERDALGQMLETC